MNVGRWIRRAALVGAAGFGAAALFPTSAPAATGKPNVFEANGHARGVEVVANTNPEPFPISNLFNEAFPFAKSGVQAGGVSESDAQSLFTGGIEGAPGLLCLFQEGACPPGFPPDYPFAAHASWPVTPSKDAPISGGSFGGGDNPNGFTMGATHAEAKAESALALASVKHGTFLDGTPLAVEGGSISSRTDQHFVKNTLVTRNQATINDATIAGLIHFDSITVVAEIHNDGVKKPVNKSYVRIGKVTVGPLDATLDQDGLTLVGNKITKATINQKLKQLGITVRAVGIESTKNGDHGLSVQAGGVRVDFTRTFSEICAIKTLCASLPPLCEEDPTHIPQPLLDLCRPPTPNPKHTYIATYNLGYADAASNASIFVFDPGPDDGFNNGGTTGSDGSTTFLPGTPGTSGTPGTAGTPGTLGTNPDPSLAGQGNGQTLAGYLEDFSGVSGRLKYLFPCLLLAVIGVLAGRLGGAPARLPGTSGN